MRGKRGGSDKTEPERRDWEGGQKKTNTTAANNREGGKDRSARETGRKRIEFSGHSRHQVPVRDQGSTKHLIAVWCARRSTWLVQRRYGCCWAERALHFCRILVAFSAGAWATATRPFPSRVTYVEGAPGGTFPSCVTTLQRPQRILTGGHRRLPAVASVL